MDINQPALRKLATLSVIAVSVLFVLGMVFYKERVFFADAAYVLFNIINTQHFAIQWERYGSFIVQLFPYMGQKMHLPVSTLAFLYGMSFNFFYLLSISLLVYWFRQYRLAILLALFYFLLFSESFIWISEIPQGITWLFLCFGVAVYLGEKKVNFFLLLLPFIALGYIAIATHFVIIIPAIFLWVYFTIEGKALPFSRWQAIALGCVLMVIILAKFLIAMEHKDSGEARHLHGVLHPSLRDIYYLLKGTAIKMFVIRCFTNYWAAVIVFIAGMLSLLKNRQFILAAWTLLTCAGYVVVMALTYGVYQENILLFHIESEWTCLGIIMATPFVFSFLPGNSTRTTYLLAGVFVVRLAYICAYLPAFSERIRIRDQVMTQMKKKGINKLVIYSDEKLRETFILDWAVPFESLMNSAISKDRPQIIFAVVNRNEKQHLSRLASSQDIEISWLTIPRNEINNKYFEVDTSSYQFMTYEELMK